ncbi:hypothetical protein [uncultured Georgenia sp.]|mgnify:CR=1 FL=1|uniref:hypothetical protein n=1 Tax=uncultured Georgenia sp. TaxID=378209 RepID=UPI002617CDD8|nr:hypothetical protein [uncultured Georgenia sp.]HLV04035.1 hypothetical protein [Actinomycetaceae bacterium]
MRATAWAVPVAALGFTLLVGGCTSSVGSGWSDNPLTGSDLSRASAEQVAEIEDGVVTPEEYQAAFERYEECLGAAGFELSEVTTADRVKRYTVPGDAVTSGADEECYRSEFHVVDRVWQSSAVVRDASGS